MQADGADAGVEAPAGDGLIADHPSQHPGDVEHKQPEDVPQSILEDQSRIHEAFLAAANDSKMDEQIDDELKHKDVDVINDTLLSIANQDDRQRIESLTQ